jgi:cation:H+ antiporter
MQLLALGAGGVMLYFGAEALVRGAAALGLRFGLTPLFVGLTVVSFGTSAPELAVSLRAALTGLDDIAVGNVVGSNICNATLILGLAALVRPFQVHAHMVRIDVPIAFGVSVLLAWLMWGGTLSRGEGLFLMVGLVVYIAFSYWEARRERQDIRAELESAIPRSRRSVAVEVALAIAGLALLVFGADVFVGGAVAMARTLGVSEAAIGLSLVAVATSLPELATSTVAAWHGHPDIAVGNVVGSNLFNILGILGVSSLVKPLASGAIGGADLAVMIASMALAGVLMLSDGHLGRWRGGILLFAYALFLAWLAR